MIKGLFARTLLFLSVGAMVVSSIGVDAGNAAAYAATIQDAREVQTHWTAEFDLPHPQGLAYDSVNGNLLVATTGEGETPALRLTTVGDPAGVLRLQGLTNPKAIAYDAAGSRLVALAGGEVFSYSATDLRSARPNPTRTELSGLRLDDPQGATFDPRSGRWYVLNGRAVTVLEIPAAGPPSVTARFSLGGVGKGRLQGLAFNPADGLLYVASPDEDLLYGVDPSGTTQKTFSLAALDLQAPVAMTFAPSADSTDDPAALHLFIADEGTSGRSGAVVEVTLAAAAVVSAPVVTATLVQTIATSAFTPGSPDPSGVVYLPALDRLQICDSEVDEVTGAGYHGVNLWQVTRAGMVEDLGTTFPRYSKEPTGLGHDPGTNSLFISDDSAKRIWIVTPGSDGRFGTPDDPLSSILASAYGSNDTEDPEFDTTTDNPSSGHLFFLDGVNTEIYDIDPVNGVFGDGNDIMTQFDVGRFGPTDFEGLGSDPVRNTLLVGARATKQIFEVTKSGSLVRIIDASGIPGLRFISGLAVAPASDGSGRLNYWIVDRAIDNGPDPTENDGKLFELTVPPSDLPPTVTITAPPAGSTVSGVVTVAADASDDQGVTRVEFFDEAALIGVDTDGSDGWSAMWHTTVGPDGTRVLQATAADTIGQTTSTTITVTVSNLGTPPAVAVLDIPVATGLDDVEERNARGAVTTGSADLDMMVDRGTLQYAVGLRFTGVQVPRGATITAAHVQFRADELGSDPVSLTIAGQASDDAPPFTTARFNVTGRPRTSSVGWVPAVWDKVNRAGPAERTPDLRTVLQEIVDRPGWAPGGAVAVIITGPGPGTRVADAFEGGWAPVLHVEYATTG